MILAGRHSHQRRAARLPVGSLYALVKVVPEQHTDRRPWTLRSGIAVSLGAIVLLAGAGIWLESMLDRNGDDVTLAVSNSSTGPLASDTHTDAQLQQLAVGTWRDFYHGRRTLTLRSDGTATMVVELSGMKARLFTPRLVLDIAWSIKDGKMRRRTVGGRPADKVAFVYGRAGVAVAEPILALDDDLSSAFEAKVSA